MTGSVHLRGIVIAGALAGLALILGFATLAMNQTASHAAVSTIVTPHAKRTRHVASATAKSAAKKKAAARRPNPHLVAALMAGLPRSVARALAARPVAIVELTSRTDRVAKLVLGEAQVGAMLSGASFVSVEVDRDGGDVEVLTRLLGELPLAPATLVYVRPAKLYVTLPGFNDRTTVEQAAADANAPSSSTAPAPAAASAAGAS